MPVIHPKICRATQDEDAFAMRWGGDEFLLISRRDLSPNLKQELASLKNVTKHPFDLHLSIGVCEVTASDGLDIDAAIKLADARMYQIKQRHHKRK